VVPLAVPFGFVLRANANSVRWGGLYAPSPQGTAMTSGRSGFHIHIPPNAANSTTPNNPSYQNGTLAAHMPVLRGDRSAELRAAGGAATGPRPLASGSGLCRWPLALICVICGSYFIFHKAAVSHTSHDCARRSAPRAQSREPPPWVVSGPCPAWALGPHLPGCPHAPWAMGTARCSGSNCLLGSAL
jgi:hypothetical protein